MQTKDHFLQRFALSLYDPGIWENCPGKKSVVNELTSACLDKALSPVAPSDAYCSIPSGGWKHRKPMSLKNIVFTCFKSFTTCLSMRSSHFLGILFLQVWTDLFQLSNPPFILPLNPFCRLLTHLQSNNLSTDLPLHITSFFALLSSSILRHCFFLWFSGMTNNSTLNNCTLTH